MKTRVAVSQMTSTDNKDANLAHAEAIIEKAASLGANVVSLPENFAYLGPEGGAKLAAEELSGPSIAKLKESARKHQIWLSLGGFQEKLINSSKIANTHLVIDDQGHIRAAYQKIHLFSVKLPDGQVYDEEKSVQAGETVTIFHSPFFIGGLSICYDIRFPLLFSALRSQGAEVIFTPAAFTETTGKDHWEPLLRARAIETQSYIVASAQIGRHNATRTTHGQAMIVDPWGTPIAVCGKNSDVAVAEIDLGYMRKLREDMPLLSQRRKFND